MKYLLLSIACLTTTSAFHIVTTPSSRGTKLSVASVEVQETADFGYPEQFDRAVECASNYGLCEVDELNKLADEVEGHEGCFFEKGEELCEKEEMDRIDVAELLRMQSELQLRQDYLKNANLFAVDVKETHDAIDREELMRTMDEMGTD